MRLLGLTMILLKVGWKFVAGEDDDVYVVKKHLGWFCSRKAQVVKLSFAMALFLSYPLQNFVAWQIVWRILRKRLNNSKIADFGIRIIIATIPCKYSIMLLYFHHY